MNQNLKNENLDSLFEAILNLKTIDECYCFFDDLCTISELKSICQRFEVAQMLDNKCVYTDIADKTGASSATISRVNRSLLYGRGGYKTILNRMRKTTDE